MATLKVKYRRLSNSYSVTRSIIVINPMSFREIDSTNIFEAVSYC